MKEITRRELLTHGLAGLIGGFVGSFKRPERENMDIMTLQGEIRDLREQNKVEHQLLLRLINDPRAALGYTPINTGIAVEDQHFECNVLGPDDIRYSNLEEILVGDSIVCEPLIK